jgi:hypothetical protein
MTKIEDLITPNGVCSSTVFNESWIWYCDEHRQHGVGLSAEEVSYYARAHEEWVSWVFTGDEEDEDAYDDIKNFTRFAELSQKKKKASEEDELGQSCNLFIIDEEKNKTFKYGYDYPYTDYTPNKVGDIQVAQELRTLLGLP